MASTVLGESRNQTIRVEASYMACCPQSCADNTWPNSDHTDGAGGVMEPGGGPGAGKAGRSGGGTPTDLDNAREALAISNGQYAIVILIDTINITIDMHNNNK